MGKKVNIRKMIKNRDLANLIKILDDEENRKSAIYALAKFASEGYVRELVDGGAIKKLAECLRDVRDDVRKIAAEVLVLIAKGGFGNEIIKSGAYGTAMEVMGEIYEKRGEKNRAIEIYRKLIDMYPENLYYYELYLNHIPDDRDILIRMGKLLYENGRYEESLRTVMNVMEKDKNNRDALIYGGYSSLKLKRYEDAINFLEKAIKVGEKSVNLYLSLAEAYRGVGEYEESLRCINEVMEIEPDNPDIWYSKAVVEYAMVDYEAALKSINKSLELKEDIKALLLKRDILKHMKKPLKLIETCRRLISLGKEDAEIFYDIARAYFDMGDYDGALKISSKIYENYLYHLPTLDLQKEILKKREQWELVIPVCETILSINPADVDAYIDIAISYGKIGDYEKSLEYLSRASKIDGKNIKIKKLIDEIKIRINK